MIRPEIHPGDRVTRRHLGNRVAGTVIASPPGPRLRVRWDDGKDSRIDISNVKRQRGGHNIGSPSPRAVGHGPVYAIRMNLGWTQQQLADKILCSKSTIEKAERTGGLPRARAVQHNLNALC